MSAQIKMPHLVPTPNQLSRIFLQLIDAMIIEEQLLRPKAGIMPISSEAFRSLYRGLMMLTWAAFEVC